MAMQDLFNKLTDDQKKKFENCKTPEELLALAKDEGFELTDDQLEALSGGASWAGDCNKASCGGKCGS